MKDCKNENGSLPQKHILTLTYVPEKFSAEGYLSSVSKLIASHLDGLGYSVTTLSGLHSGRKHVSVSGTLQ